MKAAIALATVLSLLVVAPAGAIDDTKPVPGCWGSQVNDKAGDAKSSGPASQGGDTPNLDITGGFFKYEPAKGDDAVTFNIAIKNLSTDIPPGATSINWLLAYTGSTGAAAFVRAITDFSGIVTYDYGGETPTPATTFKTRTGATTGNFFTGENGVVQIVVPTGSGDNKPGFTFKGATVYGYEANSPIPGAAPTPIKGGLLYEDDSASVKNFVVGGCPAAAPAAPPLTAGPLPGPPVANDKPLPLKLVTTKLKAKKAKKGAALKVKSTEALTQVFAQVKKGTKVLAKGSVAKLNGAGTLKVKGKLKKGSYVVDFRGTDASGAARFVSYKLKVS